MNKLKPMMITWIDSHSNAGWSPIETKRERCVPLVCQTIGFQIERKNKHTMLALSIYDPKQGGEIRIDASDTMCIPDVAILKRTPIKFPEKKLRKKKKS